MKVLISISIALVLLMSCASSTMNTGKQKDIAVATQHLGEEYYNAGKYRAALKNLLEAQKTIPDDPYLNNSLGLVYLAMEKYDMAENQFKKALSIKPGYVHATNHLGAVYMKQEKWDLAIQCFKQVSENLLYTTPEVPLSNLGWAYYNQRLYRKAKTYFKKSLKMQPDFLVSIHGLASTYIESGFHYQARDYLLRALKKHPDTAILHADIAKVYERLNDFKNAKKSWQVVLRLVPETSSLAQDAQEKLYKY